MNRYAVAKLPADVLLETAKKHKALRKRRKWTQAELAERTGVSLGSIKRFEQTGEISFSSLLLLAHVLERLTDFEPIFAQPENLEEIEKLFSPEMRAQWKK